MISREVARAARRAADSNSARMAQLPGARPVVATVAAVTGTAVDVTWRGESIRAAGALASYTPAPGDRVLCLLVDNQLIVIDHIIT